MFELMSITILTRCEYLSFPNSTLNYPYRIHRGFALSLDSRGTSNMDDGGGERRGRRERAPSRKVAESEESKAEEAREREQNKRKRQEQKKQKETASTPGVRHRRSGFVLTGLTLILCLQSGRSHLLHSNGWQQR